MLHVSLFGEVGRRKHAVKVSVGGSGSVTRE